MNFNYYLPVNVIFGCGKSAQAGEITKPYGTKALIVTGRSSAKKSGLYDKVNDSLKAAGIDSVLFDKVAQNPLTTTAIEGAEFAKANDCDVVVAIGGGSIMDCAKAIAFLAVNDGDINDYIFNRKVSDKALPLVLIPTTCGTGSEGNGFAVLTNPENGDKKSLRSNAVIAKASIVDPECMMTMPKRVLASVGFDALCHSMESYLSPRSNPVTEPTSLTCMATLSKYIVRVNDDIYDEEALDAVTLASSLVGSAFYASSLIAPHGLEHPLSGLRDMVHGRGLAALTPVIFRHSCMCSAPKFSIVSKLLGGNDETDCARQVEMLLGRIGLDVYLSDEGFCEDDIPWLVDNAFRVSKARIEDNPKVFGREEIAEIYREAM